MTTLRTVLCLRTSLAAEPSPPPMMNTVSGLTSHTGKKDQRMLLINCQCVEMLLDGDVDCGQLLWMEQQRRVYQGLVVDELVHLRALHLPVDYQSLNTKRH